MTSQTHAVSGFNRELILTAMADSFRKLSPRMQFRNPVMFVVFVCSVLTTALWVQALAGHGEAPTGFIFWDGELTAHGWETFARRAAAASLYAVLMLAAFAGTNAILPRARPQI